MYIPDHFAHQGIAEPLAFMQKFNFATIVTWVEGMPFATHLPFVVEQLADHTLTIYGHFARKNPQWETIEAQTALVIFSEPHAYISPSLYEKRQNVPTWNYVAVHAYGSARLVNQDNEAFRILEKQMQAYENQYLVQWESLPDEYKNGMIKGIVAFEIRVSKLEAKYKLSQNKPELDRQNVMEHLLKSNDTGSRAIGEMMKAQTKER
jgi:transcriptional regulator